MTNTEHLPQTIPIHAHKPTVEALLGIKYIFQDDSFMISGISDESIFKAHGDLRIGHEVVQVNGTPIAGQTKESVRTLLGSLGEHVAFAVKSSWTAKMELKPSADTQDANTRLVVNYTKKSLPRFLEGRNVPLPVWHRMYAAMDTKLVPALSNCNKMEVAWKKEIDNYEKKQHQKSVDLFATGIKHQKQMIHMTQATAALATSSSLIANNTVMWMNALLQPYGIMCQLDLEAYELPKYSDKQSDPFEGVRITGIEFTPTDAINHMDGFDISVHYSEDGSILTPEEEVDTTRWC